MPGDLYIDEKRILPIAQNYELLRVEGMRHIEALGHALWTDYNTHDPGITMLEAIVYALTELSYRNHFDIGSLLSAEDGVVANNTFFTAKNILTTAPLTISDYRKLLIDIEGVANAWFLPTLKDIDANGYLKPHKAETNIFLNVREDKLSLQDKNIFGETLTENLFVRGLNKVSIDLEEDAILGNLNSTALDYAVYMDAHWIEMLLLPNFSEWSDDLVRLLSIEVIQVQHTLNETGILFTLTFKDEPIDKNIIINVTPKDLSELALLHADITQANATFIADIIALLLEKKTRVTHIHNQVYQLLQANRNIGEDYLCIETVKKVNVVVCANVTLNAQANPMDILQKVYALIDNLFNPAVTFYTLKQLLDKGIPGDEIFTGPILQHGFIDDEELAKTGLSACLHTSDIIAAIMNLEGVNAVHNVLLSAVDDEGKALGNSINEPWTLNLDGNSKPRFAAEFSRISLFKENLPVFINEQNQKALDDFMQMHFIQKRNQKLLVKYNDLEVPSGQYYPLYEYYSIQDELPAFYAVGENNLMPDATNEQKAQSKQLKAYLHFFDQLLADLFNQLYHAKSLLDTAPLPDSYFPQFLNTNFKTGEEYFSKEIYGDALEANMQAPFFSEKEENFLDRRNRALDHLMARFCESFNDYAFMMYHSGNNMNSGDDHRISQYELIEDKTVFLNNYAATSYARGIAMNYLNAEWTGTVWQFNDFWDTTHRSGYELRVAGLLGIDETALSNIFPENIPQTEFELNTSSGIVKFKIVQSSVDLAGKWEWMQLNMSDAKVYSIQKLVKNYTIFLMDKSKKMVQVDAVFSSLADAEKMIDTLLQAISDAFENFYFLEHILFRPFPSLDNDETDLLGVCLQDECKDEAAYDPYSFKATLVLPGYVSRFRNIAFRKYAERIFRQEAPAHVLLKICWVGKDDMILFQTAYKNWLEQYRLFRIHYCANTLKSNPEIEENYITNHRQLLNALKQLNTIYPEGNLYDCQTSQTQTPMILGSSSLGTLK